MAHSDPSQPFDLEHIGAPIPLMVQRIRRWIRDGKEVIIFTARASDTANLPPIRRWLKENGLGGLRITNEKTPEIEKLYDDRAVGVYKNTGEAKVATIDYAERLKRLRQRRNPDNDPEIERRDKERVDQAVVEQERIWREERAKPVSSGRFITEDELIGYAHRAYTQETGKKDYGSDEYTAWLRRPQREIIQQRTGGSDDRPATPGDGSTKSSARTLRQTEDDLPKANGDIGELASVPVSAGLGSGLGRPGDSVKPPALSGTDSPPIGTANSDIASGHRVTGPEAIGLALRNLNLDKLEAEAKDIVHRKLKTKRPDAIKRLGYIEGFRRSGLKPSDLMITRVPVIPPNFRPYSVAGDTFIPGDANELYRDLINVRDSHSELERRLGPEAAGENRLHVYDAVRAVYGFADPVSPKTRERGVSGFLSKITGSSPKFGYFQRKLLAKDQDFSGRGVIGVDPDLELDQIGIPDEMAWKLYAPWIQRRLVRGGMKPAEAVRAIQERQGMASKMLDVEMGERPVLYSRAPSWHKFNVIAGYPKRLKGDTILINPLVTTVFIFNSSHL